MILTILGIYLLGSLLAYGRWNASIGEYMSHKRLFYNSNIFDYDPSDASTILFLSWASFIGGVVVYFNGKEKEFLRFKNWS